MNKLFTLSLMGLLFISAPAMAAGGHCRAYEGNALYTQSLKVLAGRLQYSFEELCQLQRLSGIHVTQRILEEPPRYEPIPHVWITLHYSEYSCQYFLRESDGSLTKSNCYNTF